MFESASFTEPRSHCTQAHTSALSTGTMRAASRVGFKRLDCEVRVRVNADFGGNLHRLMADLFGGEAVDVHLCRTAQVTRILHDRCRRAPLYAHAKARLAPRSAGAAASARLNRATADEERRTLALPATAPSTAELSDSYSRLPMPSQSARVPELLRHGGPHGARRTGRGHGTGWEPCRAPVLARRRAHTRRLSRSLQDSARACAVLYAVCAVLYAQWQAAMPSACVAVTSAFHVSVCARA